jgi:hypothetical protein
VFGELSLNDISVSYEHFDDSFGESLHVALPNLRIWTFQFGNYVEALGQLRKYVYYRIRKESVFTAFLELEQLTVWLEEKIGRWMVLTQSFLSLLKAP